LILFEKLRKAMGGRIRVFGCRIAHRAGLRPDRDFAGDNRGATS
jgi:hypothetical protein